MIVVITVNIILVYLLIGLAFAMLAMSKTKKEDFGDKELLIFGKIVLMWYKYKKFLQQLA